MTKLIKRIITAVFAVAMMMGMMTISAFAEDRDYSDVYSSVTVTVKWDAAETANGTVCCWCWGDYGTYLENMSWPGDTMTKVGNATWQITIPITEEEEQLGFIATCNDLKTIDFYIPSSGNILISVSREPDDNGLYDATIEEIPYVEGEWGYVILDANSVAIQRYLGKDTEIVIPSEINGYAVKMIKYGTFESYTSLTKITLPASITNIDEKFRGCINLKSITVDTNNANFASKDGILFNKDMTTLLRCPAQIDKTEFIITDGVTEIGECAFEGCTGLTKIEIPDSVKKIDDIAFSGCTGLADIRLPKNLDYLGAFVFGNCTGLQNVTMPDEMTQLGVCLFDGCSSLKSIVIPKGVTNLYNGEFRDCTSLTSIDIPDGVVQIGVETFAGCTNLEKINIPRSVEVISSDAFIKSDKVVIYCYSGSYAENFAKENNLPYRLIDVMGWKKDSTGWWYDNGDGTYPKSTWKQIDGSWYYFNNSGYMATGWLKDGGKWYYLESNGKMASNKWVNSVYYMKSNGAMAVSEWVDGGRYYVDLNGKWVPNKTKATWKKDAKGWWYDNGDGTYPKSAWKSIDGSWYYFNNSGYMVTGWLNDGGKWYYLESNGRMASSKWIGGTYYVKANGVMAVSEWVDGGRYYVDVNGKWVANKTA